MWKLNEIAQKAYECAVRRGKIDPDNDSNNNLHRDLLEEVAEVFECTGEKSPHIKEYLDVEEELADVIIVALSTLHHFKCDIDSLIEAKLNYNNYRMDCYRYRTIYNVDCCDVCPYLCTTMCL